MSDELRECPFCGGSAHVAEFRRAGSCPHMLYEAVCDDDACRGGYDHVGGCCSWCDSRERAAEIWNRRAER